MTSILSMFRTRRRTELSRNGLLVSTPVVPLGVWRRGAPSKNQVPSCNGSAGTAPSATNSSQIPGNSSSLWLGHTNGGGEPILLRPPAEVSYRSLSFAPDDNSIYYVQIGVREWRGALYKLPVFGGVPEKLREDLPI